ncbi:MULTISPECIES: SDR family NAD(P)-dependent oxidoreductase [unclassified Mesorhizobium]|uniref:SDR family NAD(P)-dependent oxidoreductase n=1 Tax=unclassified Mesorhizobium TaxID=325217 RepID=UPI00143F5D99|nr:MULTISPECIES: SDR family NAD(P)-dependent oxidoreductase [unclassified Mesorhizobium]
MPVADMTEVVWHRVMNVYVLSVLLRMRSRIPSMLERGGGFIFNTSSGVGIISNKGGAIYGAAKHAIIDPTTPGRAGLRATEVRINAVCTGPVESNMTRAISGHTEAVTGPWFPWCLPHRRCPLKQSLRSSGCAQRERALGRHAQVVDGGYSII